MRICISVTNIHQMPVEEGSASLLTDILQSQEWNPRCDKDDGVAGDFPFLSQNSKVIQKFLAISSRH